MRYLLLIVSVLFFMTLTCQVQPRYRTGETKKVEPLASPNMKVERPLRYADSRNASQLTTFELVRLGGVINTFLGKPYRGMSENIKGFDCSELVFEIFRKFSNVKLPRTAETMFDFGLKIGRQALQFGDLVFFKIDGDRISHVGIYIENNEFVHASSSLGVIISSLKEDYWEKQYAGCRRVLT